MSVIHSVCVVIDRNNRFCHDEVYGKNIVRISKII